MDQNNNNFERIKTRALIIRCSESTYLEFLDYIHSTPGCILVFSRTSNHKLIIKEEGF